MDVPQSMKNRVERYAVVMERYDKKLAKLYRNCYPNTWETVLRPQKDGTIFVLTGDIPAMWLRDSTAQVSHYIPLCKEDPEVARVLRGVIRKQLQYVCLDPYANAFNEGPNGRGHTDDLPKNSPWVWERKYEIDSLCYPVRLLSLYVGATGDRSVLDGAFIRAADTILKVWKTEQEHAARSPYLFLRDSDPVDTIGNEGRGAPVAYTGMTWSGFRPSDDACTYGYLIPSELFAVRSLTDMAALLGDDEPMAKSALALAAQIADGVRKHGVVEHAKYGKIYACEADGFGNTVCFDDANVPSLLSLPYLGCVDQNDEIYQNTRRFILSPDNPFYYEGAYAKGIGSPHTPDRYIWHIALSMQGLTAKTESEAMSVLDMLIRTDADTGFMHEGFHADDPSKFTRSWFCWSNSLFAEFAESIVDKRYI